ncbi:TPA: helix-turn-helix domain-containing protein [Mannheimia haemolytica]
MNVDFFSTIHERLKNERKRLLLTQVEMAEKCEVTPTTYSNYELGKRKPDAKFLQNFANIGGDVQYLFTGEKTRLLLNGHENVAMVAFNSLTPEQKTNAISYMVALGQGLVKNDLTDVLKSTSQEKNTAPTINQSAGYAGKQTIITK